MYIILLFESILTVNLKLLLQDLTVKLLLLQVDLQNHSIPAFTMHWLYYFSSIKHLLAFIYRLLNFLVDSLTHVQVFDYKRLVLTPFILFWLKYLEFSISCLIIVLKLHFPFHLLIFYYPQTFILLLKSSFPILKYVFASII
jgi:hypothetical protein